MLQSLEESRAKGLQTYTEQQQAADQAWGTSPQAPGTSPQAWGRSPQAWDASPEAGSSEYSGSASHNTEVMPASPSNSRDDCTDDDGEQGSQGGEEPGSLEPPNSGHVCRDDDVGEQGPPQGEQEAGSLQLMAHWNCEDEGSESELCLSWSSDEEG